MAQIVSGTAYVDTVAGTNDSSHGATSGSGACATLAYLVANRIGTLTGPLIIDCHGATADTTQPDIGDSAIGASATNTLTIQANTADRALMGWNTGKYRLSVTGSVMCRIREEHVIFDGLQLEMTPNAAATFFADTARASSDVTIVKNCVLKGDGSATYSLASGGVDTIYYWINCLFYNFGGHANSYLKNDYGTRYFYNCTAIIDSGADFCLRNDGATAVTVKNTYAGRNTGSGTCFMGTITGANNASSDTSAGTKFGAGSLDSVACDTTEGSGHAGFMDVTIDGGEDFRLKSGSYLVGKGVTITEGTDGAILATGCATDIAGTTRS